MVKRCFISGAKQDDVENCTTTKCPRYIVEKEVDNATEKQKIDTN